MNVKEMIYKIHRSQDPIMAGKLSDYLRSSGMDYAAQVRLYAKHTGLVYRDARDEWEDLMAEAEKYQSSEVA